MAPFEPQFVGTLQAIPGIISLLFLKTALDNRHKTGSRSFAVFSIGIVVYSVGLTAGNFTREFTLSMWAWNLSLFGAQLLAVSWFTLAAQVTGKIAVDRRMVGVLGAYVVGMQSLLWTNSIHEFVYVPGELRDGIVFETATFEPGFWLLFGSAYLLISVAVAMLILETIQSSGLRQKQTLTLTLGILPTIVANLISANGRGLGSHDITVFGFVITALFFGIALYSGRFLDIVPVGRQTALGEMRDAVVTVDDKNRVVDANAAAREMFDIDDDYVGTPVAQFFEAVPADVRTTFDEATDLDTEFQVTVEEEHRHFSLSISTVGEGGARGRVFVLRDITLQKRREQQLRRQNERLDQFASVLSHDLRNPLTVANGQLSLVREDCDSPHLDAIEESHERIETLIDDALTLAREGNTVTEPESVALANLAERCWGQVETGEATLITETNAIVQADPSRLRRLLENLTRNAVEHGGNNVTITVGDLADGFYFQDDGAGLPEGTRERVFETGFSTTDDGTGFGLSIVNEIVEAHNWSIEAAESPSGGARFEITGVDVE